MEDAVTGVLNGNSIEWYPDNYVDLHYEEAVDQFKAQGKTDEEIEEMTQLYEFPVQLWGDWVKGEDGKFSPIQNGEEGYAAIYDSNDNFIQVVWSKWTIPSAWCSPCFPHQGDVDNPGSVLAYIVPPDMLGDNFERKSEIMGGDEVATTDNESDERKGCTQGLSG